MRKWMLPAVLLSVGAQAAAAADVTLRPYLGYGFGMPQQGIGSDYLYDASKSPSLIRNETILFSAGAGLKAGLGVDMGLNDNFSIEPVIGYSRGAEKEVGRSDESWPGWSYLGSTRMSASSIPFSVTLKIRAGEGAFTPYAGFGPTFVFGAATISTNRSEYRLSGTIEKSEVVTTYDTGFGFHGVAGTDYKASDSFVLFFQVRADQLSLKPSKGKMTKYTVNGVDQLSTLTVSQRETRYKDDIGGASGAANVPTVKQAWPLPADSAAINFGVAYKFQ